MCSRCVLNSQKFRESRSPVIKIQLTVDPGLDSLRFIIAKQFVGRLVTGRHRDPGRSTAYCNESMQYIAHFLLVVFIAGVLSADTMRMSVFGPGSFSHVSSQARLSV